MYWETISGRKGGPPNVRRLATNGFDTVPWQQHSEIDAIVYSVS